MFFEESSFREVAFQDKTWICFPIRVSPKKAVSSNGRRFVTRYVSARATYHCKLLEAVAAIFICRSRVFRPDSCVSSNTRPVRPCALFACTLSAASIWRATSTRSIWATCTPWGTTWRWRWSRCGFSMLPPGICCMFRQKMNLMEMHALHAGKDILRSTSQNAC